MDKNINSYFYFSYKGKTVTVMLEFPEQSDKRASQELMGRLKELLLKKMEQQAGGDEDSTKGNAVPEDGESSKRNAVPEDGDSTKRNVVPEDGDSSKAEFAPKAREGQSL